MLRSRTLRGAARRRGGLEHRQRDDLRRAAVVRARHDRLADARRASSSPPRSCRWRSSGSRAARVVARLGARTSMLVADAVRAPLIALVPVLHWSGHLTFPLLLVIVFVLGVFTAPYIGVAALDHPRALRRRRAHGREGFRPVRRREPAADRDRPGARRVRSSRAFGAPGVLARRRRRRILFAFVVRRCCSSAAGSRVAGRRDVRGVLAGDPLPRRATGCSAR